MLCINIPGKTFIIFQNFRTSEKKNIYYYIFNIFQQNLSKILENNKFTQQNLSFDV